MRFYPSKMVPAEGGQPLPLAHKLWSLPTNGGDTLQSPGKLLLKLKCFLNFVPKTYSGWWFEPL